MGATQEENVVRVDALIGRISRYRTWDLLAQIGALSNRIQSESRGVIPVTRLTQAALGYTKRERDYFSQWALAFIAKHSIVEGSDRNTPLASENDLFELINMYNCLDDPFRHKPDDQPFEAISFLVRTSWEQFSFQEPLQQLIPRYLALLNLFGQKDTAPVLDIPHEWMSRTGISIEDYMVLGLAAFAKAGREPVFRRAILAESEFAPVRERSTPENLQAFFRLCTADYQRFRDESERFELPAEYAKTEFNVLRKFPLIEAHRHELIAPVPQLIIERATRGICYEMQDLFQQGQRNPFKEQFGKNFEAYVGFLLEQAYGKDSVYPEPRYGSPELRGPDWILREGDTALLFECTVSPISLKGKSMAEFETLAADIDRVFVTRIENYPRKIRDLREGATGLDMIWARRFIPIIITHDPMYIEPAFRAYIDDQLRKRGCDGAEYYLMDISDIEVITAWADKMFTETFDEWQQAYAVEPQSITPVLEEKARAASLPWLNPFLREVAHRFFSEELGLVDYESTPDDAAQP